MPKEEMPRRQYQEGVELSVIGFGGMILVGMQQVSCDAVVAESLERGVNYFDVAPFYGAGEAEIKLGSALKPHRNRVFLACKTLERDEEGAARELERSLTRLHTDRFDLYQFHALTRVREVDRIFGRQGAIHAVLRAQEQGTIRFVGFSAHSVEAAMSMLERFRFDSILFPVNYICYAVGNFGPQVLRRAEASGVTRLALKSMAKTSWKKGEVKAYPKCWYKPIDSRDEARDALRFTLGEGVTALLPPGDERLFRIALDIVPELTPLTPEERAGLLSSTKGMTPLLSE